MLNGYERLYKTTSELEEQLSSIIEFKRTDLEEDQKDIMAKLQLKSTIQAFNETMKDEYTSTENQLSQINQILALKFMNFLEES